MTLTPTAAYEILKSIVAQDTVLVLYDLKGNEKSMFVNLLSLKTGEFLPDAIPLLKPFSIPRSEADITQHSFRP